MSDLLPTVRPSHGKSEWLTDCTICRHGIYRGQEYVWLRMPTGLSHVDCAQRAERGQS